MSPEPDRQAAYDRLKERFLSDSGFRDQVQADPAGTLERELGTLTDEERQWLDGLGDVSAEDLTSQLKGGVGAW